MKARDNVIKRTVSVSRLNAYIKGLISDDVILADIRVKGMVSNAKAHASGHFYFSMTDEGGSIRCVMFKNNAAKMTKTPENGEEIVCFGRVSVYEKAGLYEFLVEEVEPVGVAEQKRAFDALFERLAAEGMFDPDNKKAVPRNALRVAVVTSEQAAALRDIISVVSRRSPVTEIFVSPAVVQGESAPASIAAAVKLADMYADADVIIVGRGGGADEDLAAFNTEVAARAVFNCKTPVISAVGHETDITLTDFAADLRAPTPSAAAEMCVTEPRERKNELNALVSGLNALMADKLERAAFDAERLISSLNNVMARKYDALDAEARRLTARLNDLSPLNVLSRGFAFVTRDGEQVNSAAGLSAGDEITITFADGKVAAVLIDKKEGER